MNTVFLFISGPEIMIIMLIVVMVFGADKIPEIARGLGKGIRQVKDATNDIKREIKDSSEKLDVDTDITKDVKKEITAAKESIDDLTGPIKRQF
jgi:sec-independent protein translocase protein TatA